MEKNTITVTINGQVRTYPAGTKYMDIAKDVQNEKQYPIALARADGRLRELWKRHMMDVSWNF